MKTKVAEHKEINAYWLMEHCFPAVLDQNDVPLYYQPECANCGASMANLFKELVPCPKPVK